MRGKRFIGFNVPTALLFETLCAFKRLLVRPGASPSVVNTAVDKKERRRILEREAFISRHSYRSLNSALSARIAPVLEKWCFGFVKPRHSDI
jgi:hypothetical protein